jgi:hypothetical protein
MKTLQVLNRDTKTDTQKDKQTGRQTDKHTYTHTHTNTQTPRSPDCIQSMSNVICNG